MTRQRLILFSLIGSLIIGALAYFGFTYTQQHDTSSTQEPQYALDKASGEEIETSNSRTPETYNSPSSNAYVVGTGILLEYGVSAQDVEYIRNNLISYFSDTIHASAGAKISIYKDSLQAVINDDGTMKYVFKTLVEDKTDYIVELLSDGISTHSMKLLNTKNSVLQSW